MLYPFTFLIMIIFIDLDGTLLNTADLKYKKFKDWLEDFSIWDIPIFEWAIDLIHTLRQKGHTVIIVSDSHPKYVNKIVNSLFWIECLSLMWKPNITKILPYIKNNEILHNTYQKNKEDFCIIGDSSLDVEFWRRLNIPTIFIQLYNGWNYAPTDWISNKKQIIKYWPTYIADSFQDILDIIETPLKYLLSLEAAYQWINTAKSLEIKWNYNKEDKSFTSIRCLARQQQGECDSYGRADLYFQIWNPQRSLENLQIMVKGIENYLRSLKTDSWDILTYVSDKKSTIPPDKMKQIFDMIPCGIKKEKLFEWNTDMTTSLRKQPNYSTRCAFLKNNLHFCSNLENLEGKNIIILDDQVTTWSTSDTIIRMLKEKHVNNILFLGMFYFLEQVDSCKQCPRCWKFLVLKLKRDDWHRFYSCVPSKYGWDGCWYIENL